MEQVVHRLAQDKVDTMTQTIEQDIITALQEIIDALKKAQKDAGQEAELAPPGTAGQQAAPLIDMLAELKMIRALQMRVTTARTVLEAHPGRAGRKGRSVGRPEAAGRTATTHIPNHTGPRNGEEPMNTNSCVSRWRIVAMVCRWPQCPAHRRGDGASPASCEA